MKMSPITISELSNITVEVSVSRPLRVRLRLMMWLLQLALWVGSMGLEVIDEEQEDTPHA